MPAVQTKGKVLVSGANGYIAMWVVRNLLEKGYAVRGTIRSASKGEYLKKYFESYGDKLELVVVPDITANGAFDEAVKGVDAIEHTASPFHFNAGHAPEELFNPAIKGTVGMLESALKNGKNVKRIVVTSSCAAVMSPPTEPTVYTENDWNTQSPKAVEEKGKDATPSDIYRASKTLAERSAWDFYEKHKSEVGWDLVVINPPYVFGPAIHDVSSPDALNTSLKNWYDIVLGEKPKSTAELSFSTTWADVRDIAEAHALALEKEEAAGKRFIVQAGPFIWQDWINVANALSPSPIPSHKLQKGEPDIKPLYLVTYDVTNEPKIMGIKLKTMTETTRDTLADFAKRGW